MSIVTTRRGRWGPAALAVLIVLFASGPSCAPEDQEPVADPVVDYQPPTLDTEGKVPVVRNRGPKEVLRVREEALAAPARLLFMRGRAASATPEGGSVWADLEGGRVIEFDPSGRVARIVQPGDGHDSVEPVVAWARDGEVVVFERDGRSFVLEADGSSSPVSRVPPVPVTGAGQEGVAATRSPLYLPLAPVVPDAPLVWLHEGGPEPIRELGKVDLPDEPMLGYLHNAGWAVPAEDGGAYFASALRPQLVRLDAQGSVRWKSEWTPASPSPEPRIQAVDGTARADFQVLQRALARGPDGHIYVLTAPDRDASGAERLLVFDSQGTLVRSGTVPEGNAIFGDGRGGVTTLPRARTLADPERPERRAFASFDLPELEGDDRVRLEAYRGHVTVVNFWASWCPPCRREIPALDSLARELGDRGVAVVGLNDDHSARRGAEFLAELGGVTYPNAGGSGTLRREYGYRGLPLTVVLDRDHRIVQSFYGFGGSLDELRNVVLEELAKGEELTSPTGENTPQ